jgi:tRNA-2-methylthio-N6-dimethylallyladenosine synthase
MNRTYTREWYLERLDAINRILPDCAVSGDIITGFCTETDEEHADTLSLMEYAKYNFAYMYSYSERPGTPAAKKFADDVPETVKSSRLTEIVDLQQKHSFFRAQKRVGKTERVLIEGLSKKSKSDYCGRTEHNSMVIFPVTESYKPGDYVNVLIERTTTATLIGNIVDF